MRAMFKTVTKFNSAFGGYEYRVTSDGKTVNYQERTPTSGTFRTVKRETRQEFDDFANEVGLYCENYDNPATIASRIYGI